MTSVVIHGHYYQPPRENPWLEEVEAEPSAAPAHDWNERIERECYRAVVAARLVNGDGRITEVVNALERTSFNFGPTLLEWMERHAPTTYAAVLAADRAGAARYGHGNALAHPFHHVILPLSTRRDKVTEVRWGIADFRRRFGREPEGMWLPETGVDDETLDVLAEHGIRFTVLAPHQATPPPPEGRPGLYRTRSGRELALFLYDGALSHSVAFGPFVRDAHGWAGAVGGLAAERPAGQVTLATDGETYGHHHAFGEMALARVIDLLDRNPGARLENYAAYLDRRPATDPVTLVAPSSWSCAHGVERWRSDCGCRSAPYHPSQQKWRTPLREAVDWLAAELHGVFERDGPALLGQVWEARDAYDPTTGTLPGRDLPPRARELLEMERNALRIFTSCAWFFDDIGGIEPVQVLTYAARAIELAGPGDAPRLEAGLLARLARAKSNDAEIGTGRDLYLARVKPHLPPAARVAAGLAALADLGADDVAGAAPEAWEAEVAQEGRGRYRVQLAERRTGAATSAVVECRWTPSGGEFRTTTNGGAWPLGPADLWDRHRDRIRTERIRRLATAALSAEDREQIAAGVTTLERAAQKALIEALPGAVNGAIGGAFAALDLLGFLGAGVPFEAQAGFARLRAGLPAEASSRLRELASRLGFAD